MAYTTLTKLKVHLQISGSTQDTLLQQLLDQVEATITRSLNRGYNLASAAATEYYDGTGGPLLVLRRRPVTAIADLRVDAAGYFGVPADAFPTASAWTAGTHFVPRRSDASEGNGGLVIALPYGAVWPEGIGNIKVTYTAGYATMPADLELAANLLAGEVYSQLINGRSGPADSETFGEYSYRLLQGTDESGGLELVRARGILAGYREVSL